MKNKIINRGFTLIELLVVVAIISLLSSIVMSSLNSARSKARDATRKNDLRQLSIANELRFSSGNDYASASGWIEPNSNGTPDSIVGELTPGYIAEIPGYPLATRRFMYFRKTTSTSWPALNDCLTFYGYTGNASKYGFYINLENPPSSQDPNNVANGDAFDLCVGSKYGMNYKIGN
ncbi:MAG: type II secretion system protein [Candidatus Paceibacterota bacterium]